MLRMAAVALIGVLLPLAAAADPAWHVAGEPAVVNQDLSFTNGDARLSGTVTMPARGEHLPAIVVLHYASTPTRDAALYRHLREALPALGFAVLVYDRRGSGASTGGPADFETLADDGIAGLHALGKLPRIDPHRIGFWGISQGGWLAVLAAGRSHDVAFAISVSAPLVTAEAQMSFATANALSVHGYSAADVRAMLAARTTWFDYLHHRAARKAAVAALQAVEAKSWFKLSYLPRAAEVTNDPDHDTTRTRLDDDPIAAFRKVRVPLLVLYGDSDPWIPVAESVSRLKTLSAQMPNVTLAVVPNADHEMMVPLHETMDVDANSVRTDAPQAPGYFMILGAWLAGRR